ncbi:Nck-associated protein 1 [Chytridium lagenaria]|nr:Nck-associated protein 1 [Chytridium lagenaria]
MEDLRSTYDLMAACAEFQETCEAALHQSVHFMTLSLEQNAHLAMLFLDNLVAYCKVAFMVSTLAPEKKILIAAYAKAYSLVVGMQEPTMTRVMKYITAYEKPLGPLQGSFLMLAPKIAALLTSLQPLLEQTVLVQGEKLRQLNYLNIASEITGVNATLHDPMILEILAKHNSLFEIFALGWLMCPMELSKSSKSADLLKHIFTLYGHNLILVGDESIDLTVEYENASRLNTKLARIKISPE